MKPEPPEDAKKVDKNKQHKMPAVERPQTLEEVAKEIGVRPEAILELIRTGQMRNPPQVNGTMAFYGMAVHQLKHYFAQQATTPKKGE